MLNVKKFVVNFIEENTYILWDETLKAAIIDCGAKTESEREKISQFISQEHLDVEHHILTHAHFDHLFGADFIATKYGAFPELCSADELLYNSADEITQQFLHRPVALNLPRVGRWLKDGDKVSLGTHTLRILSTPGHTPGGICLYCEEEQILLSGDSLFRFSIGRTDLPGGNYRELISSIENKILTLPDAVRVLPGHGPETTVGEERTFNPYI